MPSKHGILHTHSVDDRDLNNLGALGEDTTDRPLEDFLFKHQTGEVFEYRSGRMPFNYCARSRASLANSAARLASSPVSVAAR